MQVNKYHADKTQMKKSDKTKYSIILAAKKLFNTVGYFNINSNQIAKTAGYSTGTFYKYFKSKAEIFLDVYKLWHEEQRAIIQQIDMEGLTDEELSIRLFNIISPYYVEWKLFRNSVQVLKNDYDKIDEFRLEQREIIIQMILSLMERRGAKTNYQDTMLYQIILERMFDAYAHNELDSKDKLEQKKQVIRFLVAYLANGQLW